LAVDILGTARSLGWALAGILMGALKAFSRWFPPARCATISTLIMVGFGSMGGIVASTTLAQMNALFGWRGIFLGDACPRFGRGSDHDLGA
jgi:MFS family permease